MKLPGFTAEASLSRTKAQYSPGVTSINNPQAIVAQLSAGGQGSVSKIGTGGIGGPFSGSCGCWPGYCCCILCYFQSCTLYCWLTGRSLPPGF
jgi:hypothetical protein